MGQNILLLNSFSIGSLIATVFFIVTGAFLFSIKQRSRASYHLGMAFIYLAIFNVGYLVSSTIYHPLAAFHRWLTVVTILLAEVHGNAVMISFPDLTHPRVLKWWLRIGYGVSIIFIIVFCASTFNAEKLFYFRGHYWDFNADAISKVISLLIIALILLYPVIAVWKFIITKGKERWIVALLCVMYLVGTIVPAVLNTMSRDGLVDREVFNNSWVIINLTGFFLLTITYLNNAKDRYSFIGKIIGIALVTFLIMLQFSSYLSLQERDEAFDEIYRKEAAMVFKGDAMTESSRYYFTYSVKKDDMVKSEGIDPVELPSLKYEMANAYYYEKLGSLLENDSRDEMKKVLGGSHEYFGGYREALLSLLEAIPDGAPDAGERLDAAIAALNKTAYYHTSKLRQVPEEGFRASMEAYLSKENKGFETFAAAIKRHLAATTSEDRILKNEVLLFLTQLQKPGTRSFRAAAGGEHYVSYIAVDGRAGLVREAGFPYVQYRKFMHSSVLKLIVLLGVFLLMVRYGFQLFFRGVLITPLRNLSRGVRAVNEGDLNTVVPVKMEDEIGYVTNSFNRMVTTIRGMVESITTNSKEIKIVSGDLNGASLHLADIARELTSIVEEAAAAYEEMSSSFETSLDSIRTQQDNTESVRLEISNISESSGQLSHRVSRITDSINDAIHQVDVGSETINKSIRSISGLADYMKRIEETINSINEVADKINLLALNAAIEAARAGEQGRGFAVVADEVNKLADQTTNLVKGIQSSIVQQTSRVFGELEYISGTSAIFANVRSKILETGEVLKDAINFTSSLTTMNDNVQPKINELTDISNNIYRFSREQVNVIGELTNMINTITEISQNTLQNADVVRSFAKIIEQVSNELAANISSIRAMKP
ncbi:MAG TPA: methyl-accepting chemotaxis protein [Spirochaetota bacterium]|nr:methyl-accepting chemotaxis protein [Spirochaetota bacterium]HOD15529.1 methyl-accepting chemotaxis protein [Spirochaetota bacterium]HPG51501.1 methyl-accepting chemotaxis protein [Spirochaetota bacterium]HPN11969.1 methyl-accepting chemotaxis protein [Spirochaetota bacterium]